MVHSPIPSLWSQFEKHFVSINAVEGASALLAWDRETMMPAGGAEDRAAQLEYLAGHLHALRTDPAFVDGLQNLNTRATELSDIQVAAVRHQLRKSRLLLRVPAALVTEKSAITSRAFASWREARRENDFSKFAPDLRAVIELSRSEGECLREKGSPTYEALMGNFDPGISLDFVRKTFAALRKELVPLANEILARAENVPKSSGSDALWKMSAENQERLNRSVLTSLGIDFGQSRLDRSTHPFCGGFGGDIRLTTRYDESYWISSLYGTIHEAGHALYELGMNAFTRHPAVREAPGMAFHESQSRFWENMIGRGRPFVGWLFHRMGDLGVRPHGLTEEVLYARLNEVRRGMNRVESDEVTYNLHILLRFGLEDELIAGRLDVTDLPEAWNAGMEAQLGIRPPEDRVGVLQDIHWSQGAFGYFPSYALGNLISAQILDRMRADLPMDETIAEGDFAPILEWLKARCHVRGSELTQLDLVKEATARPLEPNAFISYLRKKHGIEVEN